MSVKKITLPADIAQDIETMAEQAGVSSQKQTETLLRFSLGNFPRRESLLEAAKRISAMTPKGVKQTPSEVLIREDRDR
ncbi:MAG: hypothetical protein IOC90_07660 [Methylocystis sp.]|nr:hypothetical protein [Methylocystis sp.]MCA3587893.1 hypothetical protein [Methylocystis sp.]MCA3590276.1 hypothetical protein [Methylocystis sp.]